MCSRASRASCLTCSCVLRALVPRALGALVPYVLLCPTSLVPYMLSYLTCSSAYILCTSRNSCPIWSQDWRFMSPFSLRTLLSRTLRILCPNITYCALEFPCFTLLFFCLSATCDFLREFTKVKTNIVC